jgi:nucleotide-binding universal stress UspA family protein
MFKRQLNFGELVFERILIATDGSKNSEKAAKVGIELAKLSGGKVIIVYVADMGKYMPSAGLILPYGGVSPDVIDTVAASIREAGEKATLQVNELARSSGVTSERLIVEGNPPSEILRIAEDGKVDVIVMGSIGKTGLEKFLMGSVAERVVHNSKLPVLIVR